MIRKDNPNSCIVEVEYPEKLHNLHNDYPLASDEIETKQSLLSNYCKEVANKCFSW